LRSKNLSHKQRGGEDFAEKKGPKKEFVFLENACEGGQHSGKKRGWVKVLINSQKKQKGEDV